MKAVLSQLVFFRNTLGLFLVLFGLATTSVHAQTPYAMTAGNYTEDFTNIANTTNWPNGFNGTDSAEWASVIVNATGTVGDGVKTSSSTATFASGSTGGVQRGTANIQLLSTSTANSCAIDLLLNFTGRNAGTLTFDAATVFNGTGNRNSILKVFYSTNGTSFIELTGTNLPYTATNNVAGSAAISVTLPSAFNNSATARLRFYQYSTTGFVGASGSGSQAKISVDNIAVTGVSAGPFISGAATATAFTSTYGTASAVQTFAVIGASLTEDLVATAPTGFEVSADGTTYGSTATFAQSGGNVSGSLRVRLASTALVLGSYNAQTIVLSSAGASSVNITTAASGNAVAPKTLTITGLTADDKEYDGTSFATLSGTAVLNGVLSADDTDVSLVIDSATAEFSSPEVGVSIPVIVSGYSLLGSAISNYTLQQPTGLTASITIAGLQAQTITFGALANATYGDADITLGASASSGLVVSYSSSNTAVATVAGNVLTIVGVGTTTITASQLGDASYNPAPNVLQNITVNALPVTISGIAISDKPYNGTTAATITGTAVLSPSAVLGDDVAIGGTPVAVFDSALVGTAIPVTVSGYALTGTKASNYALSQPTGLTAAITVADQTITFNALSTYYINDATFTLGATASSALAVSYSSSNTAVATISGSTVTIVGTGTATITASQAGDTNYNAALAVDQTLTVLAAPIASWNFFGQSSPTTLAATSFNANLVSAAGANTLTRGSAAVSSTGSNSFRTQGFQNNGIATTNNDYFQITIQPAAGYKTSLAAITANFIGTASFYLSPGVSSQFAYSLDGTNFTLIGSPLVNSALPLSGSFDLSGVPALQNVSAGTTITLRYYASGQTTTGGWGFSSLAATPTAANGLNVLGTISTLPEQVSTSAATDITSTSATLNGAVIANNNSITAGFEYGTSIAYGTAVTATTPTDGIVTGVSSTATSVSLSGLTPNTNYHYKAIAGSTIESSGAAGGSTFEVINSGFNYAVSGYVDTTYPTLTLVRGELYYFDISGVSPSHPFALRLSDQDTTQVPGTTNNDPENGIYGTSTTIEYLVPENAPNSIIYQCTNHSSMIGLIQIIDNNITSGADLTFYTLANVPSAPTVSNATSGSLDVAIAAADGNPAGTSYAIQVLPGGLFVQANGSLGVSAVFQTASSWSTITITGLASNTTYTIQVKAINGGGTETAYSAGTDLATLVSATPELQAQVLAGFGSACLGTTSAAGSFALTGLNLTTADVTVGPLSGFTFSTSSTGTYTSSLTITPTAGSVSETIFVKFSPTVAQSYNGNIAIAGGGATAINVIASGTGINTPSTVTSGASSAITQTAVTLAGSYVEGCSAVITYGVVYSTVSGFTTGTEMVGNNASAGSFSVALSALNPNTLYYYKAWVTDGSGIVYGSEQSFTTLNLVAPIANAASSVSYDQFVANWNTVDSATGNNLSVYTLASTSNIVGWTFPVSGATLTADVTNANNSGRAISISSGSIVSSSGASGTDFSASTNTWTAANKFWEISVNTSGYKNIKVSSQQIASNTGPRDFKIQYKVGAGGTYTDVTGGTVLVANNWTSGAVNNLALPEACDNQALVYVRWIPTSTTAVNGSPIAAGGTSRIDNIYIKGSLRVDLVGYNPLAVNGTSQAVTGLTGSTTYYYEVAATAGAAVSPVSNSIAVTTMVPPPTESVLSGTASICVGASTNISVAITGGTSPFTVVYSDGSTNTTLTDYVSGTAISVSPASSTSYSLVSVTDANTFVGSGNSGTAVITLNPILTYYADADGDGFGNAAVSVTDCVQPSGYVSNNTDCNDLSASVWRTGSFYVDADADGYSPNASSETLCYGASTPSGYGVGSLGLDCNDAVAAVNPGQTEILYNGVDDNCDGQLDEGFQLTTTLQSVSCGTTLPSMGSLIYANINYSASGYRFKVVNNATGATQTINRSFHWFALNMLADYEYATTYTISVELQKAGIWLGYYGTTCAVSSPAILSPTGALQVNPAQCGATLASIGSVISTTPVSGATGYRFRVTDVTSGATGDNLIQVKDRSYHWFTLPMLSRFNYGSTYLVEVAVKTTAGYSAYGSACTVITPAAPTLVNCGTIVPTASSLVYTSSLNSVSQYRFQVTKVSDQSAVTFDTNKFWFSFRVNVPGYTPETAYSVRVAVMTSGTWSPFGDACEIVSPTAAARSEEVSAFDMQVLAYPNPFTSEFKLNVTTSTEGAVELKVYDMLGKLIETRSINTIDYISEDLGSSYPAGVYNVIVTQGENAKTLRMIKR
jgi:hypothetical protein